MCEYTISQRNLAPLSDQKVRPTDRSTLYLAMFP